MHSHRPIPARVYTLVLVVTFAIVAGLAGLSAVGAEASVLAQQDSTSQSNSQVPQVAPTNGATGSLPTPVDVDVALFPSRDNLNAGDLWSVSGEIRNRSKDGSIWIVDKKTALMFAPEVYGSQTGTFTLIADFSTVFYDPSVRYKATSIEIKPGSAYSVTWRFNSPSNPKRYAACKSDDTPTSPQDSGLAKIWSDRFLERSENIYSTSLVNVVRNYLYFYPGTFRATATVHVWTKEPKIEDDSCVVYLADSFPVTVATTTPVQAPPWVLIFGAAVGGVICRTLQLVNGESGWASRGRAPADTVRWVIRVLLGYFAAMLLAGVSTVLFARLSTSEFPIAVKVNDFWGALATGFVVQFLGFPWLRDRLGQVASAGDRRVIVRPQHVRVDLVAAGTGEIEVSGSGLQRGASVASIALVDGDGGVVATLVIPPGLPPTGDGAFTVPRCRIPVTVGIGDYRVLVVPTAGSALTATDPLRIVPVPP